MDEDDEEEDAPEEAEETGGGAKVKLKPWHRRKGRNLGLEGQGGRPAPLIDQVHKLMHLWRAGDQVKVNDYLDSRGLPRNALFNQILQALIELAGEGSEERSTSGVGEQPRGRPRGSARHGRQRQLPFARS